MKPIEPVTERQRAVLREYSGVWNPPSSEHALKLICSLEGRIVNAINDTFDQRFAIDHRVYRILNESLKQAEFLSELPETGRLPQELREKVATLATNLIPRELVENLRVRGRKKPNGNDFRFQCSNCRQSLVVEAAGCGVLLNCPTCNVLIRIPHFV